MRPSRSVISVQSNEEGQEQSGGDTEDLGYEDKSMRLLKRCE